MKGGTSKAFTLVELLICLSLFAILASGILVSSGGGAPRLAAARSMDELEHWLGDALKRADRWKRSFQLRVYPAAGSGQPSFMLLNWLDGTDSPAEKFTADSRVRWKVRGGAFTSLYRWETHTVSPAFTLEAADSSSGKLTGEKLVVSLRALTTRTESAP
ncbi:MAG: type II secretion system protein [Pyramidobacter sp.]|jgi:prepilin-type N-terminal cleavage/methylation domain-containing protein